MGGPRDEGADEQPPAPAPVVPDTGALPPVDAPAPQEPLVTATPAVETGPDPVLRAAVELARSVAVEAGGSAVGEHLGAESDADLVVTHSFASTDPAYVGWRWTVTLARAEGSDEVTVDEVVLLPGAGALVAPAWVPWSERLQPGDLAPGDLLPPPADDPRIVPAYADPEAELAAEAFWELGLGRARVLSWEGAVTTADRWYDGEAGPSGAMARQAPGRCQDCAFLVPLAGRLRAVFGVCANGQSSDDGRAVSLDHGCGAHSETPVEVVAFGGPGMVVEDDAFELVPVSQPEGPDADTPDAETPDGHAS